jgi:very-short-patch-repair endonuclease
MVKDWNTQFMSSFKDSKIGKEAPSSLQHQTYDLLSSMDEEDVDAIFPEYSAAIDSILSFSKFEIAKELGEFLCTCESPIELRMGMALAMTARHTGFELVLMSNMPWGRKHGDINSPVRFIIEPQAKILNYRTDFLIACEIPWRGEFIRSAMVVVECDGHDYHERTKEQAKRDKKRDRVLQSNNLNVFRYTGSEIWEDVFRCAEESVSFVYDKALKSTKPAKA